jgi:adenine specific DNA methylase Mod
MTKEQKFYKALEDIFIGAKIEGEGGFVNLMRIKSRYYSKIREYLKKDIEEALKKYPNFRDELFDKLYSFFSRYFTPSGSIYFNQTPYHYDIYEKVYKESTDKAIIENALDEQKRVLYEKVYTDEKDVILFWKTHMLYYVKTDRIFKNLEIEFEDNNQKYKFFFDVSNLEYKKANEKKSLVYQFKNLRKDGAIVFEVLYSERGTKTDIEEIKKALKKEGLKVTDEILERAFSTFEKQSEVDYFINKNAKEFLREQFKLWLYQYIYAEESEWPKERIDQLQILKNIAYKIIDFISQFEDELVKIWNKPKFVLNSNYVITLDRIAEKEGGFQIIEKLPKHKGWKEQVKEWQELGILEKEPKDLIENSVTGKQLKKEYRFLPIDTKYFKDLELEILPFFDNLDESLDGWLIKSENYQALNTILPKFREKIQTIYIDPPFNKEQDADYLYNVKYKDSTWATILENRLNLAKKLLNEKGSIFVRCDYNGNWIIRPLMNETFGSENFRNEISVSRISKQDPKVKRFNTANDSLYLYSKSENFSFNLLFKSLIEVKGERWHAMDSQGQGQPLYIFGYLFNPPKGRHWTYGQEKIKQMEEEGRIRLRCRKCGYIHTSGIWEGCSQCENKDDVKVEYLLAPTEVKQIDSNWTDIPGYTSNWDFSTENSEILLKRVIESTSGERDLVMDFFLGSGTTIAVAHKLKRKWIGVEMGEHFYSVVLPRMKKVLFYDPSQISKLPDVKQKYNENKAGGFFKYYELEQYDDILRKAKYEDSDVFDNPSESHYSQYIFMKEKKLLDALEIDYKSNKVKMDLEKLHPNVDIAETLSNLKGKWIKKFNEDEVEFEEREKVDLKNLDYKDIKKLIWW